MPSRPTIAIVQKDESVSWDALAALLHEAYAEHARAGRHYAACDQTPEATRRRVGDGHCFLAFVDGKLAGTATLGELATPDAPVRRGCIYQVAVAPAFRSLHLGRAMLGHAEEVARQDGLAQLVCDTALSATRLHAWYESMGWTRCGLLSHRGTNYYSIEFCKYLDGRRTGLHEKFRYLWQCVATRAKLRPDGERRGWARLARKIVRTLKGRRADGADGQTP